MIEWIIYYADGSSFTSEDGPPEAAPRTGIQVVVNRSPKRGKQPWHSHDYYCWQEIEWVPHSIGGLHDYLADRSVEKHIVLRGLAIPSQRFMDIWEKAVRDPRMPWISDKPLEPEDPLYQAEPQVD